MTSAERGAAVPILSVVDGHYPSMRELAGLDFSVVVVMSALGMTWEQGQLREQQLQRLALAWNSHASLQSALQALQSQNEALLAGLASLAELYAMPGESNVDRFERVAEIFSRETGCYAPGKDVAAAAGDSMEIEERRERWEAWYAERAAKARSLLSPAGKDAKDVKGGAT